MEAFFSRLVPGAHIPPHYGLTNTRLTVHLPLIVPEDCGIRVLLNEWVPIERDGAMLYLAGVDDPHYFRADNLERAASMALAAGYRIGFIMGYANGVLDETGEDGPLSEQEFRDFSNAYADVCRTHPEATILEAARAAADRLKRR